MQRSIIIILCTAVAAVYGDAVGPAIIFEGVKALWQQFSPNIIQKVGEPTKHILRDANALSKRYMTPEQFLNQTLTNLWGIVQSEQRVCGEERLIHGYGYIAMAVFNVICIIVTVKAMQNVEKRHKEAASHQVTVSVDQNTGQSTKYSGTTEHIELGQLAGPSQV